jgi:hypothetical protein
MFAQTRAWLGERPVRGAILAYVVVTVVYALAASPALYRVHTPFNHFALLAEAWCRGQLDLGQPPPRYAGGNDFALFRDQWFVAFPGAPALLILPWVALAGSAERTLDGLFFLLLAGLAPAGMYLLLERLRRAGLSSSRRSVVILLSSLYAFGTVYFFTAVQGTVWYAAHVVAAAATVFYLAASIGAQQPWCAGVALAMAVGTRPVLLAFGLFFILEWVRQMRSGMTSANRYAPVVKFALPVLIALGVMAWHNWARFGDPLEFGYRYLVIAWHGRIEKWGLFGYHYVARNLGVLLTNLPYFNPEARSLTDGLVQVNGHGLALWITTPLYLWLLWPRKRSVLHRALYWTLLFVALPSIAYQNSGWIQFGQRFSNDYAPLLIVLLAVGGYRWRWSMQLTLVAACLVNLFGALTFQRPEAAKFYFIEPTQRVIYQPD